MGDLVLRTRLAILERNLEEVQGTLEAVQERRAELARLLELPGDVDMWVGRVVGLLNSASTAVEERNVEKIEAALNDLRIEATGLRGAVRGLDDSVRSIQMRSPPGAESELGITLRGLLKEGTGGGLMHVGTLQEKLATAAEAARSEQRELSADETREIWESYATKLVEESSAVFEEYVELLGGLALRANGFDRGICEIADDLVRSLIKFPEFKWNSLTVPTLREAFRMTVARIIRLGFPEWTIWALPLVGHEFGHVLVQRDPRISAYVQEEEADRPYVESFLADAFATCVMGPAYACAAILMRLDPRKAFSPEDGRMTSKRAAVILRMLRRMSAAKPSDPYGAIARRLEQEWEAALRQNGAAGSLSDEEKEAVERWTGFMEELMIIPGRALEIDAWDKIVTWSQVLVEGSDEIELESGDELGFILNAAWIARIHRPEASKEIGEAAEAIWRRKESGPRGSDGGRSEWDRSTRPGRPQPGGAAAGASRGRPKQGSPT